MNIGFLRLRWMLKSVWDAAQFIGIVFLCIFVFFISALGLMNGDLTIYSSSYLNKVFIFYTFLSIGFLLSLRNIERGETLFYVIRLNLFSLPLLVLSGQRECLPLLTPFLAGIIQFLIILGTKEFYYFFCLRLDFPVQSQCTSGDEVSLPLNQKNNSKKSLNATYECILINGAISSFTDSLLNKIGNQVRTVVLMDQDALALEALKSWLGNKYPKLIVVTSVIASVGHQDFSTNKSCQKELESFFRTYRPELVFDFDRFYCAEIALNARNSVTKENSLDETVDFNVSDAFVYRNLLFPKHLIAMAQEFNSRMVISLSFSFLESSEDEDNLNRPLYEAAQAWLECYAQHQDGSQTRVVPLRSYPPIGSLSILNSILGSLWKKKKKDVFFASSNLCIDAMLALVSQLLENPTHHGGIWSLTPVVRIKRGQLQKYIKSCDMISEVRRKVEQFLMEVNPEILKDDSLVETSLFGAALIKECTLVDIDFDESLLSFSRKVAA